MLQSLSHQPIAAEFDRLLSQVNTDHSCPRVTLSRKTETGNRETPFVDEFRITLHIDQTGIQHVADDPLNVVAEGSERNTDLRRRNTRAPWLGDGVEKISHQPGE